MISSAARVTSSSAPLTASQPTLRLGSRGPSVALLQQKLRAAGFDPGPVDGIFGQRTQAAVRAFQANRGISVDGVVGPVTWGRLLSAGSAGASGGSGPTLRQGARGEPVRQLQARLRALGFDPGPADGAFGPRTEAAVKAFQRRCGIAVDGVVGPQTWSRLGVHVSGPVSNPGGSSGGSTVTGYVNGVPRTITVKPIPNGQKMRSDAADAYNRMYQAALRDGVRLTPVSGFRTMAQQQYLYNLYRSGRGNLAARPGYSNHQGGIAADISVGSTSSAAYRWLAAHAAAYGFRRTVPSEPWHWEYRP
ncbi:MAG: peptidoglycan-binding protein [Myxococcales bacterium]|nr:peptidoglycan-binding protein [Myxococcales bacterium]